MGIFSLVESTFNLTKNVVDIVVAPVEITVDLAEKATKEVADMTNELVEEVKDL